jgi:uncharacterized repeat protein (TIGR03803 family)
MLISSVGAKLCFLKIVFAIALFVTATGVTQAQTVRTIKSFSSTTGQYPGQVILAQGRDGTMYGTTEQGGTFNSGTVFKQRTNGNGNVTLYNFTGGADGAYPFGGLTLARDGDYYGTALEGGSNGLGVLFKITSSGLLTVLYNFTGGADGAGPTSPPIEGSDGNFYGTTWGQSSQLSTLYKYNPSGNLTTIYTFEVAFSAAWQPVQGVDGNLYVAADSGGAHNCGYAVKLTTAGVVEGRYTFNCTSGGDTPFGALIQAPDGSFYGTTLHGGANGGGIIFRINFKDGAFTVLHSFGGTPGDGLHPEGGLAQATDGNFYGSTAEGGSSGYGSLFQLTPAGSYSQLYSFPPVQNVLYQVPVAPPTQDTTGTFYGATQFGGGNGLGSVYTLSMGLGPFVAFVSSRGKVGSTAQLLGQGLTGATSVNFNGVPAASFTVVSDTYMTAVVPKGATTGSVVVATIGGTLSSNTSFRVVQ